ncbi:MAG TPA: hypothetical protein VKU93_09745 [Terracidiphilus sp.]|jgi:hypothetical protein|nr:hypothetical protein [Terracidiphilus sp.]
MNEHEHSLAGLSNSGVDALLRRALRIIAVAGALASAILWIASNWRNAAMLAVGAAISAASIFEWQRLIRFINARLDSRQAPRGTAIALAFFLLRLLVFAGVIYGSLKCLRGSVAALLCGLALAVLATVWEALRLLRN